MRGGQSTSVGIVFYDTEKEGDNAVFCSFENGVPKVESGEKTALLEKMKKLDKENSREKHGVLKMLGVEILVFAAIIAAVRIFIGGFFPVFGTFIFALGAWFPILVLIFAMENMYAEKEDAERFRSFHGAEHMLMTYTSKDKREPDFCGIEKISPLHKECGTVYAASGVVLSAVGGILFGLIPQIGFLWFLGGIIITLVLLFANLFNPYNPLMLFQLPAVRKPDEKTLALAVLGMKTLLGETEKTIN